MSVSASNLPFKVSCSFPRYQGRQNDHTPSQAHRSYYPLLCPSIGRCGSIPPRLNLLSFIKRPSQNPSSRYVLPFSKTTPCSSIHSQLVMEMTNLDVSASALSDRPLPDNEEDNTSPTRGGPPSEASSQEWDKVTDLGAQTPAK
jgi:hypothetical protein